MAWTSNSQPSKPSRVGGGPTLASVASALQGRARAAGRLIDEGGVMTSSHDSVLVDEWSGPGSGHSLAASMAVSSALAVGTSTSGVTPLPSQFVPVTA